MHDDGELARHLDESAPAPRRERRVSRRPNDERSHLAALIHEREPFARRGAVVRGRDDFDGLQAKHSRERLGGALHDVLGGRGVETVGQLVENRGRVVAVAVHEPVRDVAEPRACRVHAECDDRGGHERRAGGTPECVPERHDDRHVDTDDAGKEHAVHERAADDDVDVPQATVEDRDHHSCGKRQRRERECPAGIADSKGDGEQRHSRQRADEQPLQLTSFDLARRVVPHEHRRDAQHDRNEAERRSDRLQRDRSRPRGCGPDERGRVRLHVGVRR